MQLVRPSERHCEVGGIGHEVRNVAVSFCDTLHIFAKQQRLWLSDVHAASLEAEFLSKFSKSKMKGCSYVKNAFQEG